MASIEEDWVFIDKEAAEGKRTKKENKPLGEIDHLLDVFNFKRFEGGDEIFLDSILANIFAPAHKQRRNQRHSAEKQTTKVKVTKEEREEKRKSEREKRRRERDEFKIQKLKEKLDRKTEELGIPRIDKSELIETLSSITKVPDYWTKCEEDYMEVEVSKETEEYCKIEEMLNNNIETHKGEYGICSNGKIPSSFKLNKLIRIQNKEIWQRYQFARTCIEKQNKYKLNESESSKHINKIPIKTKKIDDKSNEYYLFHGTKWEVINIVKKKGFDERVGSTSGMFGAGIYFAENSSKSNQYVPCPQCGKGAIFTDGICTCNIISTQNYGMLMCRVILGDIHIALDYNSEQYKGTKKHPIRRPPYKLNDMELYDSIMGESINNGGNKLNYREFIIYDRFQVYPEYILYFDRIPSLVSPSLDVNNDSNIDINIDINDDNNIDSSSSSSDSEAGSVGLQSEF